MHFLRIKLFVSGMLYKELLMSKPLTCLAGGNADGSKQSLGSAEVGHAVHGLDFEGVVCVR